MRILKNKLKIGTQGFTLVELMVVVAIIGILSAIAIPQYTKYQARARQSEAKVKLAGLYTAEQAYIVEAGQYSANVVTIGYTIAPGGYYASGFSGSVIAANKATGSMAPAAVVPANCTILAAATNEFRACAQGYSYNNVMDVWTMTQDKVVTGTIY